MRMQILFLDWAINKIDTSRTHARTTKWKNEIEMDVEGKERVIRSKFTGWSSVRRQSTKENAYLILPSGKWKLVCVHSWDPCTHTQNKKERSRESCHYYFRKVVLPPNLHPFSPSPLFTRSFCFFPGNSFLTFHFFLFAFAFAVSYSTHSSTAGAAFCSILFSISNSRSLNG